MKNPIVISIEEHLIKFFGNLNNRWVRVSTVISRIDISEIVSQIDRRNSNYSSESLVKLFIYKRVKGIFTFPKLKEDLENSKDLSILGLESLPTKQNFNHFIKNKLGDQNKENLNEITSTILSTAVRSKIILDINIVTETLKNSKNIARDERNAAKYSIKFIKKLVYSHIDISLRNNSRFKVGDLMDILVHISKNHDFAHNGCKVLKDLSGSENFPDGDTLLYHLKKLDSVEQILKIFDDITDTILLYAKRHYKLFFNYRVDIAYDVHKIPYYGKDEGLYVKGSKIERGTSLFYQYLTCDIVIPGRRFTLDVIPIGVFDDLDKLLEASLKKLKGKIKNIKRVFLDRGFANVKCFKVLKKSKLEFVMPMIRTQRVKRWMDKSEGLDARIIHDFKYGSKNNSVNVNLYLVKDAEGIQRCFVTNINIPLLLSHRLYPLYSARWGIETGYRVKAVDLRARTTSKKHTIRIFYFAFSTMLYNLWVLTNICVSMELNGKISKTPIITAKRFANFLYEVQRSSYSEG